MEEERRKMDENWRSWRGVLIRAVIFYGETKESSKVRQCVIEGVPGSGLDSGYESLLVTIFNPSLMKEPDLRGSVVATLKLLLDVMFLLASSVPLSVSRLYHSSIATTASCHHSVKSYHHSRQVFKSCGPLHSHCVLISLLIEVLQPYGPYTACSLRFRTNPGTTLHPLWNQF